MTKLQKVLFYFIMVALMATTVPAALAQDGSGSEDTLPNAWTPNACSGVAAIVFQDRDQGGDGVTVSLDDPWQCPEILTANQGLFVVEPWSDDGFNVDRGCYVSTLSEAQTEMRRLQLDRGSFWIVSASLLNNPLVNHCAEVQNVSQLGLNPGEGQVEARELDSFHDRAEQMLDLAGMSFNDYVMAYPNDPISELFIAFGWADPESVTLPGGTQLSGQLLPTATPEPTSTPAPTNTNGNANSGGSVTISRGWLIAGLLVLLLGVLIAIWVVGWNRSRARKAEERVPNDPPAIEG